MWFKNLTLFRLADTFNLTPEELTGHLQKHAFAPCPSFETISRGWTPPLGRKGTELVHVTNGFMLICLRTEEKLLPATVIKELVDEKVAEIEDREMRQVRRAEKESIRDSVFQELLPKALRRSRRLYAYIDPHGDWLLVDSPSKNAIAELTGLLRKSVGTLPITPLQVEQSPSFTMTQWVGHGLPAADFVLADECELHDQDDSGGVVRCKGQDLAGDEIAAHLEAGKMVTRLALHWNGKLSFILAEDLTLRRLRFSDLVQEQLDDTHTESFEEHFDARFALMTGEIAQLLPRLLALLEGSS